jgi:hypothetical protein
LTFFTPLVLARSKDEAESFLECTDGGAAFALATNEGSGCSLWNCGAPDD